LALIMGTLGVGMMISTAFSFLANNNPEVDEKSEDGVDDRKFKLLRRTFGFNPPFGSSGIRAVDEQSQVNHTV
jgi:hypothetical protein